MTKRLLAIALVVLVAVSCVYLPSVVASAAEGDVFVANKEAYEKNQVAITLVESTYNYETVNVPQNILADEAKLLEWVNNNIGSTSLGVANGNVKAIAAVEGKEKTYQLTTTSFVEVQFQGYVTGGKNTDTSNGNMDDIGDVVKVEAGTPVSEALAKAPEVPAYPGQMFLNWVAYGNGTLDNNGDGLVDATGSKVTVKANYATYTSGTEAIFYAAKSVENAISATEFKAMLNGNLVAAQYDEDGTVKDTAENNVTYETGVSIKVPYGANVTPYMPKTAADANANKNVVKAGNIIISATQTNIAEADRGTYVFKGWKQVASTKTGVLQFVATYEKEADKGNITYTFDVSGKDSSSPSDIEIKSNTLTVNADDVINQEVKDAVAKFEEGGYVFTKWDVSATGSNAVKFTAVYTQVYDYTFYYLDADGFVTKSTAKCANDAEALLSAAPAVADGYTFTKWTLGDATNKVINSMYVEGADDSELPPAKDGPASFKMAESLAADYFGEGVAPTVGKTVTLKVTGAAATFDTAVEDVNEAIKVNFTGINCDVTSEGNVATVTLTGEGTAYVVATVSYQGDVYTKTFTVTGIK